MPLAQLLINLLADKSNPLCFAVRAIPLPARRVRLTGDAGVMRRIIANPACAIPSYSAVAEYSEKSRSASRYYYRSMGFPRQ